MSCDLVTTTVCRTPATVNSISPVCKQVSTSGELVFILSPVSCLLSSNPYVNNSSKMKIPSRIWRGKKYSCWYFSCSMRCKNQNGILVYLVRGLFTLIKNSQPVSWPNPFKKGNISPFYIQKGKKLFLSVNRLRNLYYFNSGEYFSSLRTAKYFLFSTLLLSTNRRILPVFNTSPVYKQENTSCFQHFSCLQTG